ncbi:M23 M37 family [Chlorella sorokiniana]|uniref:M23 M37 family n=1 Tax=Chlorella sorokiniana TaxID=3076 RepID=A0A2P6TZA3_CHLSO|nr:M23 M37 family [Chlorella sorokiniana]|eukprot:PRW59373.1 M23 M37 family [Chlorella sorokiniana]
MQRSSDSDSAALAAERRCQPAADCQGRVPSLYPRSGPSSAFADLLWALEPATQEVGAAQIDSAAVVFPNTVRVLVRPVAGLGIVYRVQGTPLTPNAAVLSVTGAGQSVGNQLLFTFVGTATLGATYSFTVRASSSLQPGPTSAPVQLSIPQRPGTPRDLKVRSVAGAGNTSVVLADFLPPANNGGARIAAYRVTGRTKGKPDIVQSGQPTALRNGRLQLRLTSYTPLRQYGFSVAAQNPAGWGTDSKVVLFLAPLCVGDGLYGCTKDSHCCTAGYMCNRGLCQCSQKGGKCLSDASCCGGADGAAFCQRNSPADAYGTCQACIASSKFGCSDNTCCSDLMCLPGGAAKTCRCAPANSACISHDSCCKGATPLLCERSLESSEQGTCKNCIIRGRYGCGSTSNCCGANKCQQPSPFEDGTCQQCVAPTKSGCATSRNCCGSNLCQRDDLTSAVGTCESCVQPSLFGCARSSHCCDDNKCELQSSNATVGQCKECIPDSKYGCLSKAGCCTASRQCQKATEGARAGTCETCVAQNFFGCQTSADCCGGATCQKERATDQFGTCLPCVNDNKFGCTGSNSDGCCSDFMCQLSTNNARACLCSPLDATCLSKNSCCSNRVCQRTSPSDALGSCKTCVALAQSGCASASDCCTKTNFCQKENRLATTLGTCRTCVADDKLGCSTDADCCNAETPCNGGRCGCSRQGEVCSSANSCCQDGPVPMYCQKDGYLSALGTCQPCVANAKYGCNPLATDSCCDSTGIYSCSHGLGERTYACRKTLQAPCGLEDSPCQTEADCCEGNPELDLPPLYCARSQPLGRGTCKQCVNTKAHGCDTIDELSCCASGKPEKCTDNGKGGGTCLLA